jgi:hypothetical protein
MLKHAGVIGIQPELHVVIGDVYEGHVLERYIEFDNHCAAAEEINSRRCSKYLKLSAPSLTGCVQSRTIIPNIQPAAVRRKQPMC